MVPLAEVEAIVHGTTVGTNALVEHKGAKTGLIASQGFRDLIAIGRRTRPHDFGMTVEFQPLVPRDLRVDVHPWTTRGLRLNLSRNFRLDTTVSVGLAAPLALKFYLFPLGEKPLSSNALREFIWNSSQTGKGPLC